VVDQFEFRYHYNAIKQFKMNIVGRRWQTDRQLSLVVEQ